MTSDPLATPAVERAVSGPKRPPRPKVRRGVDGTGHLDDPTETVDEVETAAPAIEAPSDEADHEEHDRVETSVAGSSAVADRPRRGRRVRRIVRRIDLWSVLKLAVVLYTCLYVVALATTATVWGLAYSSGQVDKLESFLSDVGLENWRFYGDQMFRAVAALGAIGVLGFTILTVLTAALVNVISEMTGGIRVTIIEEEPVPKSTRTNG